MTGCFGEVSDGHAAEDRGEALHSLTRVLLTSDPGAARIRSRTHDIGRHLLLASPYAGEPNFRQLHTRDLSSLFAAYDARFLNGLCGELLGPDGVAFRLSSRMSRAGGKTTRPASVVPDILNLNGSRATTILPWRTDLSARTSSSPWVILLSRAGRSQGDSC